MSEQRPKGEKGQWYTLISDFDGDGRTENRKAGFTWQCEELGGHCRPKIDGVAIGIRESYRLATPEEIARAKGEELQPSKPSKEAREFWERAFVAIVQSPRHHDKTVVEMADEAMVEWQKRFE